MKNVINYSYLVYYEHLKILIHIMHIFIINCKFRNKQKLFAYNRNISKKAN